MTEAEILREPDVMRAAGSGGVEINTTGNERGGARGGGAGA